MDRKELKELRNAFADYKYSEGCGCCESTEAHNEAKTKIAKLLKVPKYKDGSGYDFYKFKTKDTNNG